MLDVDFKKYSENLDKRLGNISDNISQMIAVMQLHNQNLTKRIEKLEKELVRTNNLKIDEHGKN